MERVGISGVFGLPKILKSKPKQNQFTKSGPQNCVVKIPTQGTYDDDTLYYRFKDTQMGSNMESTLLSLGNDLYNSSPESSKMNKYANDNQIYNLKKIRAIDIELKKYVREKTKQKGRNLEIPKKDQHGTFRIFNS